MKRIFSLFLASAFIFAACTDNTVLDSPEGDVQVVFSIDGNGVPQYQLTAYGQEVIGTSSIGLEAMEANLKDGFEILKVTRDKADAESGKICLYHPLGTAGAIPGGPAGGAGGRI